jgi:hypothetical protein
MPAYPTIRSSAPRSSAMRSGAVGWRCTTLSSARRSPSTRPCRGGLGRRAALPTLTTTGGRASLSLGDRVAGVGERGFDPGAAGGARAGADGDASAVQGSATVSDTLEHSVVELRSSTWVMSALDPAALRATQRPSDSCGRGARRPVGLRCFAEVSGRENKPMRRLAPRGSSFCRSCLPDSRRCACRRAGGPWWSSRRLAGRLAWAGPRALRPPSPMAVAPGRPHRSHCSSIRASRCLRSGSRGCSRVTSYALGLRAWSLEARGTGAMRRWRARGR